jgi:predicted nucleic acid-binding protein
MSFDPKKRTDAVRYVLDSTVLIDHANGDTLATTLLERLFNEGHELFTCDVITCEMLSRGDAKHLRRMRSLLDVLEYVATSPVAARRAGESRRQRHLAGGRRALGDALIGGVAHELSATVVTRNRPDFERQEIGVLNY